MTNVKCIAFCIFETALNVSTFAARSQLFQLMFLRTIIAYFVIYCQLSEDKQTENFPNSIFMAIIWKTFEMHKR